jgi:hypothetical protein
MAWIWLDGVDAFEAEKEVRAWKKWDQTFPLMYLVELVAQAGAVLLGAKSDFQDDIVFTKIEKVEFLGRPKAGERVEVVVQPEGLRREGGWFLGRVFQDDVKLLEGRVLLMNIGRLRADGQGPITFPEQLMEALK